MGKTVADRIKGIDAELSEHMLAVTRLKMKRRKLLRRYSTETSTTSTSLLAVRLTSPMLHLTITLCLRAVFSQDSSDLDVVSVSPKDTISLPDYPPWIFAMLFQSTA